MCVVKNLLIVNSRVVSSIVDLYIVDTVVTCEHRAESVVFSSQKLLPFLSLAFSLSCVLQILTSVCWLGSGKVFGCSYSDGSIVLWNPKAENKPEKIIFPHSE